MRPIIVALTGASGAVYGVRLVQVLREMGRSVVVIISEPARLVIQEEMGISLGSLSDGRLLAEKFHWEYDPRRLSAYSVKDLTAPVASGSYPVEGMVIAPCSMGTLGAVASGIAQNLIHRAADCCLKENTPLVILPRETPLSVIHLENMLKLARLGVRVVPAMPGFYSGASSVPEMIDFMTGKVLDQLKIPHSLFPRWVGKGNREAEHESQP